MVYSCNYPIWVTFETSESTNITYSIQVNDTTVYNGLLSAFDTTVTSVTIDVSNVIRDYLETFYEDIIQNNYSNVVSVPTHGLNGTRIDVVVYDDTPTDPQFKGTVVYDYNTDYKSELTDIRYLNNPITNYIDMRQNVPVSAACVNSNSNFEYYRNGVLVSSPAITSSLQYALYWVNVKSLDVEPGDTLRFGLKDVGYSEYNVVSQCRNRFVLYYVNKAGGLDCILCGGRYIES